jgi:hypothetical protein
MERNGPKLGRIADRRQNQEVPKMKNLHKIERAKRSSLASIMAKIQARVIAQETLGGKVGYKANSEHSSRYSIFSLLLPITIVYLTFI